MGGPAAGVLLRDDLTDGQIADVRTWLSVVADVNQDCGSTNLGNGWEFRPNWPADLGEEPEGGRCPGSIQLYRIDAAEAVSGASFLSPADWQQYGSALGWVPACELSIAIYCNRRRDHQILAWLCVELAKRLDGMIDLDGPMPIPPEKMWLDCGLRGRAIPVVYAIDESRSAKVHVVDADFLRSWMSHPDFHMVK
jgi:hypothetical protein